jgi:DNA-binding transcriptional MerR regulator
MGFLSINSYCKQLPEMKNKLLTIRNDLAGNKHDKVFSALKEITKDDTDLQNQLLTLMARYKDIRRLEIIGAFNAGDGFMHRANLNMSILTLINQVEEQCLGLESEAVFISYSRTDAVTANLIKKYLVANNINVVIDDDNLTGGKDITAFIRESIRNTGVTLSIISKKSLLSSWVAMESILTFQQEKSTNAHRFIGCYIDKDFLSNSFTNGAIATINEELNKLLEYKKQRIDQGLSTRDLDNEFTRWSELRQNIDEIIRRLRENLCIDVHESVLEANLPKIIDAIRNTMD